MCGIAGSCDWEGLSTSEAALARSLAALAHRGPDGTGQWIDPTRRVALLHTRLAIIDLEGGAQPLGNEDGTIQVVFNGEIYNHVELRRELAARGHRFRTHSDTEVLVHLYEERGSQLVDQLVGMFAFALWDARQEKLLVARDRLGQKPLYLLRRGRSLAFASELKGLAPFMDRAPQLDPAAVSHFLTFQYVPGDACGWKGVEKLEPGQCAEWTEKGLARRRYWSVPRPRATFAGSFDDAADELRLLLREATRIQLRSDVPLGVLLSGGLDSAMVVGLAAECGVDKLHTYTAVFDDPAFDERRYARAVADRFGTDHHELTVVPPSADVIEQIIDQYDEPFSDSSAVPTWLICGLAREHVKVALSGDGGDEALLGYRRYAEFRSYLRQHAWFRPLVAATGIRGLALRLCPQPGPRTWRRRLRTLTTRWDPVGPAAYERWIAIFNEEQKARLLTDEFRAMLTGQPSSRDRIVAGLEEAYGGDWVEAAAAFDAGSYLPDAILTKVDRASMAHGLECRSPLLDHRVFEFLATLPAEWKLHPRHGSKWIMRRACRDLFPDEVLSRGKMGFGVPVGEWFRREWQGRFEDYCLPRPSLEAWLQRRYVQELIDEHRQGRVDHTYRLWTLACLNRAAARVERVS